jgi:hypothetical protein
MSNQHLLPPTASLPGERTPCLLSMLIHPIAHHVPMCENLRLLEHVSPTHLTLVLHRSQVVSRSNFATPSFWLWWESQLEVGCFMRSSSRAFVWYLGRGGPAGLFARDPAGCVICMCSVHVASMCRVSTWVCYCTCCPPYGLNSLLVLCHMMSIKLAYV